MNDIVATDIGGLQTFGNEPAGRIFFVRWPYFTARVTTPAGDDTVYAATLRLGGLGRFVNGVWCG